MLTVQQIKKASQKYYMNDEQLEFFRNLLLELHESTIQRIEEVKQQLAHPQQMYDDSDRATHTEQLAIALRVVEREQKLLPKIQKSLKRIRTEEYGYCLETGEPIGILRLLARPTAEYCADIKELKEKKENLFSG